MGKKKRTVPRNWQNCPEIALSLILGKFLVFKTPLGHGSKANVARKFNVCSVFEHIEKEKLDVGLWIDLTLSNTYYDRREVEQRGCHYFKLKSGGHRRTVNEKTTKVFISTVIRFIDNNPEKVVAVHCTHGFNRTGFLIVSYITEVYGWDVEDAVAEFAKIRPPGIYRRYHLVELARRYKFTYHPKEVPLPAWCYGNKDQELS